MWFSNYFVLKVLWTFQRNILLVSTSWPRRVEKPDNVGVSNPLMVTLKEILELIVIEARGSKSIS